MDGSVGTQIGRAVSECSWCGRQAQSFGQHRFASAVRMVGGGGTQPAAWPRMDFDGTAGFLASPSSRFEPLMLRCFDTRLTIHKLAAI